MLRYKKAFIFDFDGVLIDSEPAWDVEKAKIFIDIFGEEAAEKIGLARGLGIDAIFERALRISGSVEQPSHKAAFIKMLHQAGDRVYQTAPISEDVKELIYVLRSSGFALAIVSATPASWINMALARLQLKTTFDLVLSLEDNFHLAHKPEPDGFDEALKRLDVQASSALILEDSAVGIAAAKASGAYTIAFSAYEASASGQTADAYAKSFTEVINLVRERTKHLR